MLSIVTEDEHPGPVEPRRQSSAKRVPSGTITGASVRADGTVQIKRFNSRGAALTMRSLAVAEPTFTRRPTMMMSPSNRGTMHEYRARHQAAMKNKHASMAFVRSREGLKRRPSVITENAVGSLLLRQHTNHLHLLKKQESHCSIDVIYDALLPALTAAHDIRVAQQEGRRARREKKGAEWAISCRLLKGQRVQQRKTTTIRQQLMRSTAQVHPISPRPTHFDNNTPSNNARVHPRNDISKGILDRIREVDGETEETCPVVRCAIGLDWLIDPWQSVLEKSDRWKAQIVGFRHTRVERKKAAKATLWAAAVSANRKTAPNVVLHPPRRGSTRRPSLLSPTQSWRGTNADSAII